MEPLLRWAGSKRWHVDLLRPHVGDRRLVELFAGSAALSFGLQQRRVLLNDLNPHVINLYRHVRQGMTWDLISGEYYEMRAWFNEMVSAGAAETEMAAKLFYYLNVCAFNHLCRFNRRGQFNVPARPNTKRMLEISPNFERYRQLMARQPQWCLCEMDFGQVLIAPEDFIYADPPYDGTFDKYCGQEFSWTQHVQLADQLSFHVGPVVLCNAATERVLDLYRTRGFHVSVVNSPQRMHHLTARSDKVREVIASNFLLPLETPRG